MQFGPHIDQVHAAAQAAATAPITLSTYATGNATPKITSHTGLVILSAAV